MTIHYQNGKPVQVRQEKSIKIYLKGPTLMNASTANFPTTPDDNLLNPLDNNLPTESPEEYYEKSWNELSPVLQRYGQNTPISA